MTVREVYVTAAAFIGDRENDDLDERDLTVPYMAVLLQESLNCENSMRERDGQDPLPSAPVLGLDDEIPYHDSLVRGALPYGLAWQYHQEAGNLSLASQFRNMFIDAVGSNYCFSVQRYT